MLELPALEAHHRAALAVEGPPAAFRMHKAVVAGAVAIALYRSREFFAVVQARVQTIDWMELHADGHRRAIFDARGARWVQP